MECREISPQMEDPQDLDPLNSPALVDSREKAVPDPAPMESPHGAVYSSQMYPGKACSVDMGSVDGSFDRCSGEGSLSGSQSTVHTPRTLSGRPAAPPKDMKPYLVFFSLFPKLPREIQDKIWRDTLEPRTIDLQYHLHHGFFTRTKLPIALRVCPDSRNAVIRSYPLSFGSQLHRPDIVFNFCIDTLYFDSCIQSRVTQFLVSLSKTEMESVRYIAVDEVIEDVSEETDYVSEDNAMTALKVASRVMTKLKEVFVVSDVAWSNEIPWGSRPITLFEDIPYELQKYMWECGSHLKRGVSYSEYVVLPDVDERTAHGFDAEKVSPVYGWRPTDLSAAIPFWFDIGEDLEVSE